MANNIIRRVWNQNRMVNIEDLYGAAFQAEIGGHTFEISGLDEQPSIIIVEDESVLLKGFVHILEDTLPRADIYGFETGAEALRFAESNHVAAAFLDIELFGESGIDLAAKLMELNPHTNIIFLTGHTEYTADALDLHCSGYILKPLTPEKVLREAAHLRFPVRGLNP